MPKKDVLTIALPKGRLLKEAVEIFVAAGIDAGAVLKNDRRLIFENPKEAVRFMVVRAQDVPAYVEYGAADLGIAEKDVLIEQGKAL